MRNISGNIQTQLNNKVDTVLNTTDSSLILLTKNSNSSNLTLNFTGLVDELASKAYISNVYNKNYIDSALLRKIDNLC